MAVATSTAILVAAAAATAVTAYGQYQQGQDAKKAADYNAAIMERNRQAAEQKAQFDADAQAAKLRRLMGAQRAAAGASGYQKTGSILDLQEDTVIQGTMDQLATLYGGKLQGQNYEAQANLSRMEGTAAARAGTTAAAGTLLGGASRTMFMNEQLKGTPAANTTIFGNPIKKT